MRISILPEDPGYSPQAVEVIYAISVNGIPIDNIITADEELSIVQFYALDNWGNFIETDDGELEIATVTGEVDIMLRPGICPALIMRAH